MAATKHTSTLAEMMKINELLKEHLTVITQKTTDNTGLVHYKDGMTDDKVAKLVSSDCTGNNIRRVRLELFGQLHIKTPSVDEFAQIAELQKQVIATHNELDQVKIALVTLQANFNKLAFSLNQKGYADSKHLLIKNADGSLPGLVTKGNGG